MHINQVNNAHDAYNKRVLELLESVTNHLISNGWEKQVEPYCEVYTLSRTNLKVELNTAFMDFPEMLSMVDVIRVYKNDLEELTVSYNNLEYADNILEELDSLVNECVNELA